MDLESFSYYGKRAGFAIAVIPAAISTLIACSKFILINVIADFALSIITSGEFLLPHEEITFVAVPLLWKISLVSAGIGASLVGVSILAAFVDSFYQRYNKEHS